MPASADLHTRHNGCQGAAAPVLLIHGAGQSGARLTPLLNALAALGRPAFSVDLPGHGGSEGAVLESIPAMARSVAEQLADSGPLHVAGHSMGGLVALELAATEPELLRSLSLLGTIAPMPVATDLQVAAREQPEQAVELMLEWGYTGTPEEGERDALLARARAESLTEAATLASDLQACTAYEAGLERAAAITLPVLVLTGRRDAMTPPRHARRLISALAEPQVEWLASAGHFLADEVPAATGAILADFLTQADNNSRPYKEP